MACIRCDRKDVTDFTHQGKLCPLCFTKEIELRIRRSIRKDGSIKPNMKLILTHPLIDLMIRRVIKYPIQTISIDKIPKLELKTVKNLLADHKADRLLIPWTLKDEAASILSHYTQSFDNDMDESIVKFFKAVKLDEVVMYAKLNKRNFKPVYSSVFDDNILRLENGLTGSEFSLIKSHEALSSILKDSQYLCK